MDTPPPPDPRTRVPDDPRRAQDWIDEATSQGVPPDYRPPVPPGQGATLPETTPPSDGATPDGATPDGATPDGPNPHNGVSVVDTSSTRATGLDKCPRCGSTEISLRPSTGKLICAFCRFEWAEAVIDTQFGFDSPISQLHGTVMGSGASNVQASTADVLTLKCAACGAEVVVNTAEATQARCHWCRNTLSVNHQLPNGAVPDGVLPFTITRDDAVTRIDEFVKNRRFFAHPQFVREFAPTEVVGVYLPYLLVDANIHVALAGEGEVQTATYTREEGDKDVRYYDADQYRVGREFDLAVDDVVMESSQQRADIDTSRNTNNVINAIQPFDVKAAVSYNANYLRGFTSERRDLDISQLRNEGYDKLLSIGRARSDDSITRYDRGVRWEQEELTVKGTRWVAVYLPVWLYSYFQPSGSGGLVHYVAVNGRTGTTMGSVPVRQGRLLGISLAIGIIGTIVGGLLAYLLS